MTTVATGAPSYIPAVTEINNNFIVSNGDADGGAIDNDDGSSHYDEHHNFCVYGGAKMGNIDGHGKSYHNNVNVYVSISMTCPIMASLALPSAVLTYTLCHVTVFHVPLHGSWLCTLCRH